MHYDYILKYVLIIQWFLMYCRTHVRYILNQYLRIYFIIYIIQIVHIPSEIVNSVESLFMAHPVTHVIIVLPMIISERFKTWLINLVLNHFITLWVKVEKGDTSIYWLHHHQYTKNIRNNRTNKCSTMTVHYLVFVTRPSVTIWKKYTNIFLFLFYILF